MTYNVIRRAVLAATALSAFMNAATVVLWIFVLGAAHAETLTLLHLDTESLA